MNNSELKRVFLEAAEIIEKDGLAKRVFIDGNHCACTTAAIGMALGAIPAEVEKTNDWLVSLDFLWAEKVLFEYLLKHNQVKPLMFKSFPIGEFSRITGWNDDPERTAEEVVSTLRDLAESLDG